MLQPATENNEWIISKRKGSCFVKQHEKKYISNLLMNEMLHFSTIKILLLEVKKDVQKDMGRNVS